MNLIFLFALLLLYLSGFVLSLFVSHAGWVLSLIAFVTMCIALLLKGRLDLFNGKDSESWLSLNSLTKLRRYTWIAMPILMTIFVVAFAIVFNQPGVCVTDGLPVFAKREHYVLVSHGTYTEVSQTRYYLAGVCYLMGWHSIALIGPLEALGRYAQKEIYRRER